MKFFLHPFHSCIGVSEVLILDASIPAVSLLTSWELRKVSLKKYESKMGKLVERNTLGLLSLMCRSGGLVKRT